MARGYDNKNILSKLISHITDYDNKNILSILML